MVRGDRRNKYRNLEDDTTQLKLRPMINLIRIKMSFDISDIIANFTYGTIKKYHYRKFSPVFCRCI